MQLHTLRRRTIRTIRPGSAGRRLPVLGAIAAAALVVPVAAVAATGTATITAGSLGFVTTPPNVSFSATLNGLDQTVTSTQALDVSDATGSGTGWNLTATSTTFTTGGGSPRLLATTATSLTGAPTDTCDASATCTVGTNSVTYPYVLPAGATAPTATKLFNAAANTGLGNQTITPSWKLAVPASTYAGTYTSTWTISLVSGP
jgi:WxL domain surface cell wall-binding